MSDPTATALARAKRAVARQRRRDAALGPYATLMGEPIWDMLLQLYIARLEGRTIATAAIAKDANVAASATTAWVATLSSLGLVERVSDPSDARRRLLDLTATGAQMMERAVDAS